jgi:GAF domain-containing protein
MQIFEKRLDFDRGIILLSNRYKTRLDFKAGFGYPDEQVEYLKNTTFNLDQPGSKGIFVVSFKTQKPFLINDINEIQDSLSQHSLDFARKLGVKSFICCPIIYNKESLGVLAVDNINSKRPLLQSDLNMLMGIAPQIGISLHNAMLKDAAARQFKSIIQVLEANMEAHKMAIAPSPGETSVLEKGIDSNGSPLF